VGADGPREGTSVKAGRSRGLERLGCWRKCELKERLRPIEFRVVAFHSRKNVFGSWPMGRAATVQLGGERMTAAGLGTWVGRNHEQT